MQLWYNWLHEMKKKGAERLTCRVIVSAEGGAGSLHKITKDVRRGGKNGQNTGSVTRRCKV